jgi:hypothetical protein
MNQTEVTKNALLKGLCKDCKYYADYMCTRISDKFLEKQLNNDTFEKQEVGYEDLLEYTKPNKSCKFWEANPEAI